MGLMDHVREKTKANVKKHIVLPEGNEPRIVKAAAIIAKEGIAEVTILGDISEIDKIAVQTGSDLKGVNKINPASSDKLQAYADTFYELRKAKGVTREQALETMKTPMYYGTMMVKLGDADGLVGGALCTTGDTMRPGLQIVKTAPGVSTVSSCIIIELPHQDYGEKGVLVFADCAINIDPTSEQLADIAIASAATAKSIIGMEPKIAMLSFSTKGSAKHAYVDKVARAVELVKQAAPQLNVDGELQADAALVDTVGQLKSPGSSVAGHANVLIFPDLQSGNIGYKLVQRLAGAKAIGPICQGFAKPISDLSRGCTVDDIVNVVILTSLQAQG